MRLFRIAEKTKEKEKLFCNVDFAEVGDELTMCRGLTATHDLVLHQTKDGGHDQ